MRTLPSLLLLGLALTCSCSSTGDAPSSGSAGTTTSGASGGPAAGSTSGGVAGVGTGGGSSSGSEQGGTGGTTAGVSGGGQATAGAAGQGGSGQAGSGGQGGSAPSPLRITTSNIRYGTADDGVNAWPKRKELLFTVLRAQAFDTAGLQEALAAQLTDIATALPEYGQVGVGRDDGKTKGEYSAILYLKERYEVASSGTFWFSDTPEVPGSMSWGNTLPRICTWARFKSLKTGRSYYHYNIHLDNVSQPSREKSSQLLAARMAARSDLGDPVILTGDFNALPSDLAVTYLLGSAKIDNATTPMLLVDAWLALHVGDPDALTFHSFDGGSTGDNHIDYIMFDSHGSAKSADIIRTHDGAVYPSDHYPVSAVLELSY